LSLDIERIQAICFDVDGTISDTDDRWVSSIERWLKPVRSFLPHKDHGRMARWIVMALETPANFLYSIFDRIHLDNAFSRIYNAFSKQDIGHKPGKHMIIPRVMEMLTTLREHYPMAIVSASKEKHIVDFLRHFQLDDYFKAVATSQTCVYTKPFPHPIHWAAERLGVDASNLLMVGDTIPDIRAGRAAGAQTVAVLCGFGTERELRRAGADLIVENTADLINVLIR